MARIFCLLVAALFLWPLDAQADARCLAAQALRGHVKTVRISTGKVAAETGAPLKKPHLWERWDISRDRRTITVIQYSADAPSLLPLFNLWPRTICEFDEAGSLVRSWLKLNGLTTYTTVETAYDAQGRKLAVQSRSRNPEFTSDTSYEYADNAVTVRTSRGYAMTKITERDARGRVAREISRDETTNVESSHLEYRYGTDTVEILGRENGEEWRIWKKMDAMGNTIESRSFNVGFETRDTFRFDYDAQGNWIRAISFMSMSGMPPPRIGDLSVRQISYWR